MTNLPLPTPEGQTAAAALFHALILFVIAFDVWSPNEEQIIAMEALLMAVAGAIAFAQRRAG